ncbi:MAG TPA: trypsin-like peptidase domain-containing protein [Pyrinomonadaceae bacterium]|nr:trypsin-like peptidase domain-containing protein [Pyrinomonadaceae bacterium]
MYRLSARQILLIALLSGLFAAGLVACMDRLSNPFQPSGSAFTETPPSGITDPSKASDEQNNIEVYKAISPGVAFITTTTYRQDFFGMVEEGQGSGSGSVIDDQGHILTNYHVIEGVQKLTVSLGADKNYPARPIGGDPDTDLAVIKIEAPRDQLTVVPLGDSDKLVVGQKVLAIGNPFGLDRTLTTGVISGLQRPIRARNNRPIEGAIQTDASINPGNSGGPLLDSRGRMIGINSQILSPSGASAGVGFAVPVNIAKRVVPQLIRNGRVLRPKLGIGTRDVRDLRDQVRLPVSEGVIIINVAPGGAAEAAGLRGLMQTEDGEVILGDIIMAIEGEKVGNSDDLYRILDKHQIGDIVRVEVVRGNGRVTVPVRLIELPDRRRGIFRR